MDKPRLSAALVVAAAGAATYANCFGGAFVFDDNGAIVENPTLLRWSTLLAPPAGSGGTVEGRPLLNATFGLNWWISGPNPWSYHVFNVGVHLTAALLLLALLWRTLPLAAAFAGALVWTVHPLLTESVTYIAQRAESLAAALTLATLYTFVRSAEADSPLRRRAWAIGSWAACLLGMGVKETMYCAPLLVLLYDRAFLAGSFGEALRRRGRWHLGLWLCLLWLASNALSAGSRGNTVGPNSGIPWAAYAQTEIHSIAHYLRLSLWPSPLIFDYGVQWYSGWAIVPSAVVVCLLLALTLVALVRWPRAAFLGCVFFLILAPTSLIPGNRQTTAEHRMYLPLAAVAALLMVGAARRFKAASWGIAALALPLALASHARNRAYASPLTLYRDSTAKLPSNPFNHFDVAHALRLQGDLAGAAAELRETLSLDPNIYHAQVDLGDVLSQEHHWQEADAAYRNALLLNPNDPAVRFHLGQALLNLGRREAANEQFNDAWLLDPSYRKPPPVR